MIEKHNRWLKEVKDDIDYQDGIDGLPKPDVVK